MNRDEKIVRPILLIKARKFFHIVVKLLDVFPKYIVNQLKAWTAFKGRTGVTRMSRYSTIIGTLASVVRPTAVRSPFEDNRLAREESSRNGHVGLADNNSVVVEIGGEARAQFPSNHGHSGAIYCIICVKGLGAPDSISPGTSKDNALAGLSHENGDATDGSVRLVDPLNESLDTDYQAFEDKPKLPIHTLPKQSPDETIKEARRVQQKVLSINDPSYKDLQTAVMASRIEARARFNKFKEAEQDDGTENGMKPLNRPSEEALELIGAGISHPAE